MRTQALTPLRLPGTVDRQASPTSGGLRELLALKPVAGVRTVKRYEAGDAFAGPVNSREMG
ncbi:MAG: hypothetical protein F4X11_19510 [Acidobacteria bacterium]|nr:hypothetical protein [Acidobacteriota bacterium]